MARAKQPVSVNGIEFDALMSEDRGHEATVPEYPVETGFVVSDAIILGADTLNMVLFATDTPVTWRGHAGQGHADQVCQQLEELYYTAEPVTVVTTDKVHTNMAIESIGIKKSTEIGYAKEVQIAFRKIRTTSAKTTTIPESYGKSGATAASAGTANTSTSGSDGSRNSGIGSGGGSSSGSGSGKSSGSSKSSILYSAANAIGLM